MKSPIKLAIISLAFFLFISTMPAIAAPFNVSVNVSLANLTNSNGGFQCVNSTIDNQIYCYTFGQNSGAPTWQQQFVRYNATLESSKKCSLSPTYGGGGSMNCPVIKMALLNESYILFQCYTSGCDLWDISNISNGVCAMVHRYASCANFNSGYISLKGVANNSIYQTSGIMNKENFSDLRSPYWASSYDWGTGVKWVTSISIPNKNDADNIYLWSNYIGSPIWKYTGGNLDNQIQSLPALYGICNASGCGIDLITTGSGEMWLYALSGLKGYRANFSITANYSSNCQDASSFQIGTTCDDADSNNQIYQTKIDDCTLKEGSCPSGSICNQLTPQINVSSSLIEDYISCQIVLRSGARVNCLNICPSQTLCGLTGYCDTPLFSNCVDSSCKHCTINNGNYTGYNVVKYTTDTGIFSVPSWTIKCADASTGETVKIVDQYGNDSSEIEILEQGGINVTETGTTNQTAPTDIGGATGSAAGGLAGLFGTLFGITDVSVSLAVFSLFISIGVGIVLMYYTRNSAQGGNTFIFGVLAPLIMFAVMGWFPAWILILLLVAGAFLVAKSMGIGGA